MGPIIDPETAVITKTTKALLVLPVTAPAIASKLATDRTVNVHATANCCQCRLCTDMCPRALIGYPLEPHKIVRNSKEMFEQYPEEFTAAAVCCGCGICELTACCQGISPRRVYDQVKRILAKNKLRYQHRGDLQADPDRDYRMLPSERFKQRIGVARYDTGIPEMRLDGFVPSQLELPLQQHIGAPAKPVVAPGDIVTAGQLVAEADGMISANIHASVGGRVASVTADRIIIDT